MNARLRHPPFDVTRPEHAITSSDKLPGIAAILNTAYPQLQELANSEILVARLAAEVDGDDRVIMLLHEPIWGKPLVGHVKQLLKELKLNLVGQHCLGEELFRALATNDQASYRQSMAHGNSSEIRQLDDLIGNALRQDASDLHFERRDVTTLVRLRVFGELFLLTEIANETAEKLIRLALTELADDGNKPEAFALREKQQASLTRKIAGITVKLRAQTTPAFCIDGNGQDLVMRLLPQRLTATRSRSLAELGYLPEQAEILSMARSAPYGVTVFAGITGSGKSTTLENMIRGIVLDAGNAMKIITVEDPNEFIMPGTTQIPVTRNKTDDRDGINPFAEAMRAAMRMDGDVIMVGEVRDTESALCLQGMVLSGHAVFTTVHATSAINIPLRLSQMGLQRNVLGNQDFFQALCYQRLLQVVCPDCSVPINNNKFKQTHPEMFSRLLKVTAGELGSMRLRGQGCPTCRNRGVINRTVCAEVVAPDMTMLRYFAEGRDTDALLHWRGKDGIKKTALGSAVLKMQQGLIDPNEFEAAFGRGNYLRELVLTGT